jgi:hypothetical protein
VGADALGTSRYLEIRLTAGWFTGIRLEGA